MSVYNRYKFIKSLYNYVYKDVHLNMVVNIMLWSLAASKKQRFWRSFMKIVGNLDVSQLLQFESSEFIVMKGRYVRKDHLELLKNVLDKIGYDGEFANAENWHHKFTFHPLTIVNVYRYVFSIKGSFLSLKEKCVLANELIYYCNTIDSVAKIKFKKVKKFLCLADALEIENLMTQFFQSKGIQTYSLMDGIYFVYKGDVPFDVIQYENLVTDCKLSWGEYSQNELVKYGIAPGKIQIAGYPKFVEQTKLKSNNSYKKCLLLLARDSFRDSNMFLLNILSHYSKNSQEIWIKLHPRCEKAYYQDFASSNNMHIVSSEKTINECLNQKDFDYAISVNTTAYYEALIRGLPCLRLYDGKFNLMYGMEDAFGSLEEFKVAYDKIRNMKKDDYQSMIDETLKYAIGFGLDRYKEIII